MNTAGSADKTGKSKYQQLAWLDLSVKLKPMLDSGELRIRPADGKIVNDPDLESLHPNYPWLFVNFDTGPPQDECLRLHKIYFDRFNILPSRCLSCFKVVVSPQNLEEMFAMRKLMRDLNFPGKLGMEMRDYVRGLWKAFFYCNRIEHGIKRYNQVRRALKARDLGHLPVILKRGCTEYERDKGPSDNWDRLITKQQLKIVEPFLDRWIEVSVNSARAVPPWLSARIQYRWIEWAAANGDETYLKYTDGKVLDQPDAEKKRLLYKMPDPPVTYHHLEGAFDSSARSAGNAEEAAAQ